MYSLVVFDATKRYSNIITFNYQFACFSRARITRSFLTYVNTYTPRRRTNQTPSLLSDPFSVDVLRSLGRCFWSLSPSPPYTKYVIPPGPITRRVTEPSVSKRAIACARANDITITARVSSDHVKTYGRRVLAFLAV